MFTGIVQDTLPVIDIKNEIDYRTHILKFTNNLLSNLSLGDSVAHNGCCLTVSNIIDHYVEFNIIKETLKLTNLGLIKINDTVNIERAASLNKEIGGHVMSGHIICTANLIDISYSKHSRRIWFNLQNSDIIKYIFYKGYIGIDGISLTINDIKDSKFCVDLIPETIRRTNLSKRKIGDIVNIEIDQQSRTIVDSIERFIKKN
ncbi:riboflavin synthase subunit alpha [Candidatus Schneideria nysicola]|uniref:riboflavin synthase subunit alpha n=1 Tax=Candidatus Schneideria nysicola TaxID=1081631 RepID=UPI001CAA54B3|nr:riboflavin synthase subunit alpha [Candidatus Schneideria nysicola]UAJ65071.1 riboflavin synthase subunit alpha [Candidatus Schneideria nysicola]UAJ66131.1 riboflavin synthase subunit alpha [Candidatus Schneideria nysicola]